MNYNAEGYLKAVSFLSYQISKKGYNWDTGRMKPIDSELYVNAQIEVGGTVDLLIGATKEERGITNFNGQSLTKDRVFVADGIRFGVAEGKDGTLPHSMNYNYSLKSLPTYLAHANIVMKQKDEVIFRLPISSIAAGSKMDFYRDFQGLALIEDNAPVTYQIEFPQGVKGPTDSVFVSVYLRGFETYIKR